MKRFQSGLAVVGLLLVGVSASVADEGGLGGDVARLQGKWECRAGTSREFQVSLDVDGKRVEVLIQTPQGLKLQARGEIRLDETTSPRKIDWIDFSAGDFQAFPEVQGVYKIEGDSFVICNGGFNGARPVDFIPGDGPLADVVTFRRNDSAKVADASPSGEAKK
ncbi:hypothetical protein [Paludisphaera soli]|uniref:hypothetical protein n=1 Tax=Paludisphaera soli TaxID=2712865 RepID=UPI0013E9DC54|nr:hypothetical protein [Paludisphaera soli]